MYQLLVTKYKISRDSYSISFLYTNKVSQYTQNASYIPYKRQLTLFILGKLKLGTLKKNKTFIGLICKSKHNLPCDHFLFPYK